MVFSYLGPWLSALLVAYIIGAIVFVLLSNRPPTHTLAWILLLVALPGLGVIIYVFLGRDWHRRYRSRRWFKVAQEAWPKAMAPIYERFPGTTEKVEASYGEEKFAPHIAKMIDATEQTPPLPVREVEIYPHGEQHFAKLLEDCSQAQKFIHLQYFIWEHDELTAKLTKILIERLKAGVEVRVIYDFGGSFPYRKNELHAVEAAGGKVAADIMEITRLNYRNHRKIAIIDGVIGYTGGMNMGQEYADGGKSYPAWRDTQIRVIGPGTMLLQRWFAERWLADTKENIFTPNYFFVPEGEPGDILVQIAPDGPHNGWNAAHRASMIAITEAKHSVWVQSPYFVPDESMIYALQNAALSGVDAKFMMTGWPDKKAAFWAAQTYWREILDAGVRLYLYEPGFMHAKTIVVDGIATGIGSMNFDQRSFFLNQELVMWVWDRNVAQTQAEIYREDLLVCREITLQNLEEMNVGQRLAGSISRLASGVF